MSGNVGLGQDGDGCGLLPFVSTRRGQVPVELHATIAHTETGSGSDKLQMGLGYTPAIPSNTVKSIKILTQHVREHEQRKEKELKQDYSDTEGIKSAKETAAWQYKS